MSSDTTEPSTGAIGYDPNANKGPRVIGVSIALLVLSTTFVSLRFWSRAISKAGLWWDDWIILLALLLSLAPLVINLIGAVSHGFGRHLVALGEPTGETDVLFFFKVLYIYQLFYWLAIGLAKVSILAFYQRIFPEAPKWFKRFRIIMGAVVGVFFLITEFIIIFECTPIDKLWMPSKPGRCLDIDHFFLAGLSINIVLDFITWLMVIPMLWRLRITKAQRFVLTVVFAAGGFVCIAAIIRAVVLSRLETSDLTWNFVDTSIWGSVENSIGICSACIITLRPLFATLFLGSPLGRRVREARASGPSNSSSSSRRPWRNQKEWEGGLNGLDDPANDDLTHPWRNRTSVHAKEPREEDVGMDSMPPPANAIQVQTEVTLSRSDRYEWQNWLY